MKKLLILFAFALIILNMGYINAFECYQESANETNQTGLDTCSGLNYTGKYDTILNSSLNDGNWSTKVNFSGSSHCNTNYYSINYSKPNNDIINVKWNVKADTISNNYTLPSDCLNINDKIYLQIYTENCGLNLYCFTNSNMTIHEPLVGLSIYSGTNFYEESIIWDLIANISNSSNSSNGNINLSLIKPSGYYYGGSYIPIEINVSNSTPYDKCWYNVTRGSTTLEIANTFIDNCSSTQFIVSDNANYLINVCVNDTLNNITCANSIFTTIPLPAGSASPGGGGGGSYVPEEKNETIKVSVCENNYPPLKDAWKIFNEKKSWDNFKILWFAYWDYSLCKSAANIIPVE